MLFCGNREKVKPAAAAISSSIKKSVGHTAGRWKRGIFMVFYCLYSGGQPAFYATAAATIGLNPRPARPAGAASGSSLTDLRTSGTAAFYRESSRASSESAPTADRLPN